MKSHTLSHARFDPSLDLPNRIALVESAYKKFGHINRKTLIATYGVTQLQAGSLMRDFIHAHANNLEWDVTHSQYRMKN
jgi:hypothetical protein